MDNQNANPLPLPTIRRYPIFLRAIGELMDAGESYISSSVLAERLGLDPVLTRKDLAMAGVPGRPRRGYPAPDDHKTDPHLPGVRGNVFPLHILIMIVVQKGDFPLLPYQQSQNGAKQPHRQVDCHTDNHTSAPFRPSKAAFLPFIYPLAALTTGRITNNEIQTHEQAGIPFGFH